MAPGSGRFILTGGVRMLLERLRSDADLTAIHLPDLRSMRICCLHGYHLGFRFRVLMPDNTVTVIRC